MQGVIQRERRLQQELEEVEAELSWAGRDREVQVRLRDLICRLRMAHKSFRASLEVVQMPPPPPPREATAPFMEYGCLWEVQFWEADLLKLLNCCPKTASPIKNPSQNQTNP